MTHSRDLDRKVYESIDIRPSYLHIYRANCLKPYLKTFIFPKILDVGCWTGQMAECLGNKIQYYGVDINAEAVGQCQLSHKKSHIKIGTVLAIPFPSNYFDIVIFSEVLEHLPPGSEAKAVKEIYRVLKKDGLMFLTTPYSGFISKILDPAYILVNHRHYSMSSIRFLLKSVNFTLVSISLEVGAYTAFEHIVHLTFKHILGIQTPVYFQKKLTEIAERELYSKKGKCMSIHCISKK